VNIVQLPSAVQQLLDSIIFRMIRYAMILVLQKCRGESMHITLCYTSMSAFLHEYDHCIMILMIIIISAVYTAMIESQFGLMCKNLQALLADA
jgi:hypothetical protein